MNNTRLVAMEINLGFIPNPLLSQRWCSGLWNTRTNPRGTPVGAPPKKSAGKHCYVESRSTTSRLAKKMLNEIGHIHCPDRSVSLLLTPLGTPLPSTENHVH